MDYRVIQGSTQRRSATQDELDRLRERLATAAPDADSDIDLGVGRVRVLLTIDDADAELAIQRAQPPRARSSAARRRTCRSSRRATCSRTGIIRLVWAYAITAPGQLSRVEAPRPEPGDGQQLVRLRRAGSAVRTSRCSAIAAASTSSTTPVIPGTRCTRSVGDTEDGTRIVGWASGHRGLAEYFLVDAGQVIEVEADLSDVEATVVQPLATVLYALHGSAMCAAGGRR